MQAAALRSSFQQLVMLDQVQRPASSNTNPAAPPARSGSRCRQQRGWAPAAPVTPLQPVWPLAAVRADQAADTADTGVILQLISDITRQVDETHAAALSRNAAALEGLLPVGASELKQRVQASILDLQSGLLERETEVGAHYAEINVAAWSSVPGSTPRDSLHPPSFPPAGPPAAAGGAVRRAPAAAGPPRHCQVGALTPPQVRRGLGSGSGSGRGGWVDTSAALLAGSTYAPISYPDLSLCFRPHVYIMSLLAAS